MVVSGDRDAYQLVDDGVRVMSTSRGVTDTKIYDTDAVIERYGVPPELVPDLIGLKGDTSDNIPGVPGIGEKTASQLLQKYGSVEGVLDNIDEISGPEAEAEPDRARRRRADLQAARDDALRRRGRARPRGADGARARPLPPARGRRRVRAAPGDPAARGRVGAAGPRSRSPRSGSSSRRRRGRSPTWASGEVAFALARRRALGRLRRRAPARRRRPRGGGAPRRARGPSADRPRRQVARRAGTRGACSARWPRARSTSPTTRCSPPT